MLYLADFLLSWFQIAVSFFVTMLLFWLGFSIVLAGEKKSFGGWFGGLGFLGGGIFFASSEGRQFMFGGLMRLSAT